MKSIIQCFSDTEDRTSEKERDLGVERDSFWSMVQLSTGYLSRYTVPWLQRPVVVTSGPRTVIGISLEFLSRSGSLRNSTDSGVTVN